MSASISLLHCEIKGVHRRAADGRFVYIVEVCLYICVEVLCTSFHPPIGQMDKQYDIFCPSYLQRIL